MVEDVLSNLGHSPQKSRLETKDEWPAWSVQKGSAHVYIQFHGRGEENFLKVTAPVMHADTVTDLPRLMRRLLELNATEISGAAFALRGDDVVLTAERTTLDLDRSEVLDLVKRVEDYADHWDDILVAEFGGRPAGLSAAPID